MSKKDYIAVAKIINDTFLGADANSAIRGRLAVEFADLFSNDNPNFDRARFYLACGVTNA